jgi:hypothetical protein
MQDNIDLETFLKSAGQSFSDAQRALLKDLEVSVNMMLSNAELELKVAVSSDAEGRMSIKPISSEDIIRGDINPGMLSTIRVAFVSSIGEIKTIPQPASANESTDKVTIVPNLVGRTLDESVEILKSGGWQFEPHAASSEEITASGKETHGQVLRQQPSAGQSADKAKTTVHIWADLGSTPVKEIDGIGDKLGDSLSKIGIKSIGELSLANINQIASTLRISEARAQGFVDMAGLMSRLAILGFKDEVVELLVNAANIRFIEQLANADSTQLYHVCQEAIKTGKVRVPRGFKFTANEVEGWINTAKSYLGK